MKFSKFDRFSARITHAYLMLTEQCPLDCEYCYIEDRTRKNQVSMEDVDALIARFSVKRPRIIFFGGEPLLKVDMIKEIVDKYGDQCVYQIITSSLCNWERAVNEVILPHKDLFDVQVSWDGLDVGTRLLRRGADRSDRVLENIIWAGKQGAAVEIRAVINDTNVDYLPEIVNTFRDLRKTYPRISGDLTIAHQTSFQPDFHLKLRKGLDQVFADFRRDIRERGTVAFMPRWLSQKIGEYLNPNPSSSCDAGSYVVMRPDGVLFPCTIMSQKKQVDFSMGKVAERNLDWDKLTLMRHAAVTEQCGTCEARNMCDGGCRFERVEAFHERWIDTIHEHTCRITFTFRDAIRDFINSLSQEELRDFHANHIQVQVWTVAYGTGDHDTARKINTKELTKEMFKPQAEPIVDFRDAWRKKREEAGQGKVVIPITPAKASPQGE